jgi:hypothetical protein
MSDQDFDLSDMDPRLFSAQVLVRHRQEQYERFTREIRVAIGNSSRFNDLLGYKRFMRMALFQGIEMQGDNLWDALKLRKGESLFELGPGYGLLAIKAALSGLRVVAVEHPKSHYLPQLRETISLVQNSINNAEGQVELLEGNILASNLQEKLRSEHRSSFDHIAALDVLRPGFWDNLGAWAAMVMNESLGPGAGKPKYGIYKKRDVKSVLKLFVDLKRATKGTLLVNHTLSLERTNQQVDSGDLNSSVPFREIPYLEDFFKQGGLSPVSSERAPTTRTPLHAAKLYRFAHPES